MSARRSGGLRADPGGDDLVRIAHRLAALDLVHVLHAFYDLAPNGVLLVEEAGVTKADEELRVRRMRRAGAGHRAGAAHVRLTVELGLEVRKVRAAAAGAGRIAGLRHKALDHAVERYAVVKALARERLDAFDVAGREVGAQLDDDAA